MSNTLTNELLHPKPFLILPKLLYVISKKEEKKLPIKVRALHSISIFLLHFCRSHLFFSFLHSLWWCVPCQVHLFPKSFSFSTYCQKVLNVLFHTGTVRDTNQKKDFLARFFSCTFLFTYNAYFQTYVFHDCFLCQSLTFAISYLQNVELWMFAWEKNSKKLFICKHSITRKQT